MAKTAINRMTRYALAGVTLALAIGGCTQRPPFMENADPALRKSSAQFAADAAKRHYETDAPTAGEPNGRVEVDYGLHRINIVNAAPEDWADVEIWVNQNHGAARCSAAPPSLLLASP